MTKRCSCWSAVTVFVLLPVLCPTLEASSIEKQPPAKIFAASCSTCHGPEGRGGKSWVDGRPAPWIAGLSTTRIKEFVRKGYGRTMPGFGQAAITSEELDELADFIRLHRNGVPLPAPPAGKPVRVDILDADPWYFDDGSDLLPDGRRVLLQPGQFPRVVNTGRTWHTVTNDEEGKDSGLIGYAQYDQSGYYDADPEKNLAKGCVSYHCHLHPYMQVEICTAGSEPKPLTRANKNPIGLPPTPGVGEIWIDMQTQEEDATDFFDGSVQVIDPASWQVADYIPNVGNNPHSSWSGRLSDGRNVIAITNWHDNYLTLIDMDQKAVIINVPTGAAPAHIQVSPTNPSAWFLTHHGSDFGIEAIDMDRLARGDYPILSHLQPVPDEQQTGAHGIWFCDDGDHLITANAYSNSVSLYSIKAHGQVGWAETNGEFSLNADVALGGAGGCRTAYVTNFNSSSVSVFDIDVEKNTIRKSILDPAWADEAGNLRLLDETASPVVWATGPTQAIVSPSDSTAHSQFMVISNKTSFNATILPLDSRGLPLARYNFPTGLGAHGVSFGRKAACDSGKAADVCYYAYVTNSFDDYFSVFDLERIAQGRIGRPGSSTETVHVEGALAEALAKDLPPDTITITAVRAGLDVPITIFCPDCRSGGHVGDVPLRKTTLGKSAYIKQVVWVDDTVLGGSVRGKLTADLEIKTDTGAFGIYVRGGHPQWR